MAFNLDSVSIESGTGYRGQSSVSPPGHKLLEGAKRIGSKITRKEYKAPVVDVPAKMDTVFQRSVFINEASSRVPSTDAGKRRKGNARSQEFSFNVDLNNQYSNFSSGHVEGLLEVHKSSNAGVQAILNNRQNDRTMIELLTSFKKKDGKVLIGQDGRPIRELDKHKIENFLKTDRGWIITTQILEQQSEYKMAALSARYSLNPRGHRRGDPEGRNIALDMDRGIVNKFVLDKIAPWLNQPVFHAAGRPRHLNMLPSGMAEKWQTNFRRWMLVIGEGAIGSTAASLALTGILSEMSAAGMTAVGPALYMLSHMTRGGVNVNVDRSVDLFRTVKQDPAQAEYMRLLWGIDVNDYSIVALPGGDQIRLLNPERGTNDMAGLQEEIMQNMYTRLEFYTSLGVPHDRLDALPTQFIYSPARTGGRRPEQMRVRWQKNTMDRIRDMGGFAAGGTPGAGLNVTSDMQIYDRARNLEIGEELERYMEEYENPRTLGTRKDDLVKKLDQRTKDSVGEGEQTTQTMFGKRRAENEERAARLNGTQGNPGDVQKLEEEKPVLEIYNKAVEDLSTARREAKDKYGVSDIAGIDAQIKVIDNGLVDATIAGSIAEAENQLIIDRSNFFDTTSHSPPPDGIQGLSGRLLDSAIDNLDKKYASQFRKREDDIKGRRIVAEDQKTKLKQLSTRLTVTQDAVSESNEIVRDATITARTLEEDYNAITSMSWEAINISQDVLLNQPIEEIMRRINGMYAVSGSIVAVTGGEPIGWPASQNERGDLRLQVLHAITQARGIRMLNITDSNYSTVTLPRMQQVLSWEIAPHKTISENELCFLTRDEVMKLINQANAFSAGGWPDTDNADPGNIDIVDRAMRAARERLQSNIKAYQEQERRSAEMARFLQADKTVDKQFKREAEEIEVTIRLTETYENVANRGMSLGHNIPRLTDRNIVQNTDATYSEPERALAASYGYYEIVDGLFDYRGRGDRAEYFQIIQRILPPDRLAAWLNDSLGLGLPAAGVNMDTVLQATLIGMNNRTLHSLHLGDALRDVINRLVNEMDAY